MTSEILDLAEAYWVLGSFPPEETPGLACQLLEAGIETDAVVQLAGLRRPTRRDLDGLFERMLKELGRQPILPEEAGWRITHHIAGQIVRGELPPYPGAAQIASRVYHAAGRPSYADPFYYWADEWEDHPEYRESCEADIRAAAAELWARAKQYGIPDSIQ